MVHERYLVVLLPPFPLWLALRCRALAHPDVSTVVTAWAGAVALFITVARPVSILITDSRLTFPYAAMAGQIAVESQEPVALLADRPENAANLAIRLPGASISGSQATADRLLLVGDDAAAIAELRKTLSSIYVRSGELRRLQAPRRWPPKRTAQLFVESWAKQKDG